jgi:flagellar motor switch protein FliN
MNQANASAETGDEEQDLDRAIDELRGVLKEDTNPSGAADLGGNTGFDASDRRQANADIIMNIPVEVQIVLGSADMQVSDLMALKKGAVVALDRKIGEPVDVVVNGRKIARGEITVLENDASRFGIKLTEIISKS